MTEAFPEPVRVPEELAAVLAAAVARNLYRDALARADVELELAVEAALSAGHPVEEVLRFASAFRVDGGPYPPPPE